MKKKKRVLKVIVFMFFIGVIILFSSVVAAYGYVSEEVEEGIEVIDEKILNDDISWPYPEGVVDEYVFLSIDDVSEYLVDGYVAVEDKEFYNHFGLNIKSLGRASWSLIKNKGKITQGGSSITQQVIKNNVLTQEQTFKRKFTEMFLALYLEYYLDKDDILELYFNSNYYNYNCYGVNSASMYYFGKSPKELSLNESALLVGLSNSPTLFDPINNYEKSINRKNFVLGEMLEENFITESQYLEALEENIVLIER